MYDDATSLFPDHSVVPPAPAIVEPSCAKSSEEQQGHSLCRLLHARVSYEHPVEQIEMACHTRRQRLVLNGTKPNLPPLPALIAKPIHQLTVVRQRDWIEFHPSQNLSLQH